MSIQQPPAPPWYVVHTRPRRELFAASVIENNLDLHTWAPEVTQSLRGARRLGPLFPGYVFVQAGEHGLPVSYINTTPGVLRVVAFETQPQPLDPAVIAALRSRVEAVNADGGLPQHPFHEGETVRIRGGPLAGLEAVFLGPMEPAARVEVLLKFLGSQRTVQVAPDNLETVANPIDRPPHSRRSRGKGRPIHGKADGPA